MENATTKTNKEIKAYLPNQLSEKYGVHIDTFKKWIKPFEKEIGNRKGNFYTPKQVSIIIDCLGEWW